MNLEIRYSPPNQSRQVVPVRDRLMIGSLLSNEVVIRASGVEPIHAMIEVLENGVHLLTDLGSQSGVLLNGKKIDVESPIKIGDKITIGNVLVEVFAYQAAVAAQFQSAEPERTRAGDTNSQRDKMMSQNPPRRDAEVDDHDEEDMSDNPRATVRSEPAGHDRGSDGGDLLFSPRNAKPSGNVLECVAYWDDTVLDADMFHPKIKNNERVTIGIPGRAHFLAGGTDEIKSFKLASVTRDGYKLYLRRDMTARIRRGGKVIEESGDTSVELGRNDIAHVSHGALKYFLMFIKPPVLELPRQAAKDPFFFSIIMVSALLYFLTIPAIYLTKGPKDDNKDDDIWSIVNQPEKQKEMPKPPPKPKVEVAKVETPPPPKVEPPKPPPKPPTPVPPEAKPKPVEKPQQTKPVEKPVEKKTELAEKPVEKPQPPKAPAPAPKNQGMVSTGAKAPDFKNPGKQNNQKQGLSGGERGGGKPDPAAGGARKGNEQNDLMGAEGGAKNKASGVNLGALGLGVGKVLNKSGAGAIKTDFKDSAGGAGGGAGSASKTYGLGGPGAGSRLGVSGTGGAVNNFGGFGGNGSGAGGSGGLGGEGLGKGFGKGGPGGAGRANVEVPPGDPVVTGGLTTQEVQAVIRANLNQIRHCYEQLLQRSPNANGKIKVNFVVNAEGRVSSSSIQSDTIGDSVMAGCVTSKIVRWAFPKPRGGQNVNVNYPFVFNPL